MSKFKVGDRVKNVDDICEIGGISSGDTFVITGIDEDLISFVDTQGDERLRNERHYILCGAAPHYIPDASGKDYLARCEETYSRDEMIGAYRFTIGKYVDRMGKKQGETVEKELDKIIDYATRAKEWLERQS